MLPLCYLLHDICIRSDADDCSGKHVMAIGDHDGICCVCLYNSKSKYANVSDGYKLVSHTAPPSPPLSEVYGATFEESEQTIYGCGTSELSIIKAVDICVNEATNIFAKFLSKINTLLLM